MTSSPLIHFHDFHPALGDFKADILAGLKAEQKTHCTEILLRHSGFYAV